MTVKAHFSVGLPQAFVIGEGEVVKLAGLLSARIGVLEIRVDCADGASLIFKNAKELNAFENPRERTIKRIVFSAQSEDFGRRATIDLSGLPWGSIRLEFVGPDDALSRLRSEVIECIGGMRPWYDFLHRINFVYISAFVYCLIWLAALVIVSYKGVSTSNAGIPSSTESARGQLSVLSTVAILFALGFGMNRFRDSLFPRAIFLIGQGKSRFQLLDRIQWVIIMGFIVSLAAGIVVAVWQGVLK